MERKSNRNPTSSRPLALATVIGASVGAIFAAVAVAQDQATQQTVQKAPRAHVVPTSPQGNLVVGLCDGDTALEVDGVKAGQPMERGRATLVADQLMAEWRRKNPGARWEDVPRPRQLAQAEAKPPKGQSPAGGPPSAKEVTGNKGPSTQTGTYSNFGARDEQIWRASTQQFIERGHKVFHDVKELGGTTGISCDMCHPDGANTHPETYPKYQVQLGRVALLRDMINWCIENPVRGKPLADGDERMRAMEAYLYAQRKGTPLEYGKR